MAVLHTALRRKKVVYLVPLKALAEEKFLDFHEKYANYGLRVIISTRDHREFDEDFESGHFSIAVVVYEKLAQLLVRRPERIEEIDLIIADELELLSDPDRGPTAEILLTRILQAQCRLIGLSAVIGEAEKLAQWMQAELVRHERRPVELRYGVLYDGVFKYRTYNELGEGEEAMADWAGDTPWEILLHNVCALTERGEPCLVFVKAKHESRKAAEILSGHVSLPAANRAIGVLEGLESTRSRDSLLQTLNHGVAFHNADLSPLERRTVEQAFREGEVRLLVSTGTLAAGMNLPARNVFISPDRWQYDDRVGMPWKTPILRAEYENMSGRAGRYGAGHGFGRSFLIAATPFDQETLWRRYIEGEREGIEPQLARAPLENHVLRLVASRFCRTAAELQDFLESTLTGTWLWRENYTRDEIAARIRAAIHRALDAGVLATGLEDRLEATPFGLAAAGKGISIATARELERWIAESENRDWTPIDLIFAAASTPDGRMLQVLLTAREYERGRYPAKIKARAQDQELRADVPLNRIRNCNLQPFFEEVRAIKTALFLDEWIDQVPMRELEERYNTMAGQILAAAVQVSWLMDAAAALATTFDSPAAFVTRLRRLAERVACGLREEALPLARLDQPQLDRNTVIALCDQGLHTPKALHAASCPQLAAWMSNEAARQLKAWALAQCPPGAKDPAPPSEAAPPALLIDDHRPGEIHVDGIRVPLQDKQYRLIRLLAAHPGRCIPYETIYQELWGGLIVENNQLHFQKRKLIQAIAAAVPQRGKVIRTIPKRGFCLDLDPEVVGLHTEAICTAA